jgi:hypothetical protein
VNLQHLHIEPLTANLVEFLKNAALRLITFGTKIGWTNIEVDVPCLASVFSASSLATLENLTVQLVYWDAYVREMYGEPDENQTPVIDAITSNLRYLQNITFQLPIDINWRNQFSSLHYLKCLKWSVLPSFLYQRRSLDELREAFKTAGNASDSSPTFVFTYAE